MLGKSTIGTNREKLLLLMNYISKGAEVLEILVSRFIRTWQHVMEWEKMFDALFHDNIVEGAFEHFDETTASAPGSSIVFDCIVCPIRRQNQWYNVNVFFGWKNGFYSLKNEPWPTF